MGKNARDHARESTDTGETPLPMLFPRGEGAVSSSRNTGQVLVIHPSGVLAVMALLLALAGAGMSIVYGRALMLFAIIGWVLAGPLAAVLIVVSRRINLTRSASARFVPSRVADRLHVIALIAMFLATIACAIILGPWVARW